MAAMMSEFKPLQELLDGYKPFDELEALHVEQVKQFLSESKNPYARENLLGHVVADAWIVNPNRDKVVLIEHALTKTWMAPGGHCDGNPNVLENALREAQEETSLINLITLLNGNLFDVNVGYVPTRKKGDRLEPTHLHVDICFAFEAPEDSQLFISDESTNLAWIPVTDIPKLNFHPDHYRRPAKTVAGLLK